jgi:hypothetical protein
MLLTQVLGAISSVKDLPVRVDPDPLRALENRIAKVKKKLEAQAF